MEPSSKRIFVILLALGLSGMTALIYEVTWTRLLVLVFGSTVYALSTMLAAFMAGLALGSFFVAKRIDRIRDFYLYLAIAEIGIGVFALIFPLIFPYVQYLYLFMFKVFGNSFVLFQIVQGIVFLILLLIPTFLFGMTFPLASKIIISDVETAGKKISYLYSSNSLGSVIGPILAGFILIPLIGVRYTSFVAAFLNILIGIIILYYSSQRKKMIFILPLIIVLLFISYTNFNKPLDTINSYYIHFISDINDLDFFKKNTQVLFYKEGAYSTIEVVDIQDVRFLKIDGRIDASTSPVDVPTQILLADIPLLINRNASEVLLIGLGGGFTLGQLKNFDVNVDVVEIEPAVIEAEKFFSDDNKQALDNDKSDVIVNDARNFLLSTDKKYDIIISGPSHPITSSVNHLFTKDFFNSAKSHLNDNGIFAQWLPTNRMREVDYKIAVNTLLSEFSYVTIWKTATLSGEGDTIILATIILASNEPYNFTIPPIENEDVIDELKSINLNSNDDVNSLLLLDFNNSKNFVSGIASLNTDQFPLLEFQLPKASFDERED
ncbi:MAG: fused MFS/spermidine synthase [Candidatus Aenigmarchaeota archaeon]|nr:fused MFS/spermidine synthase [Candidatus Aenigmarchaeota archaeon]